MNTKQSGEIIFFLFTSLLAFASCNGNSSATKDQIRLETHELTGKELSFRYCKSCHLYPEPTLLDKATWEKNVLIKKGYFMGVYGDTPRDHLIEGGKAGELVRAANIFPENTLIDKKDWIKIVEYYVSEAPTSLPVARKTTRPLNKLMDFKPIVPDFRTEPPMTTLVRIDEDKNRIYVGDAKGDISSLTILDNNFNILNTVYVPTPPSDVNRVVDSLYITMMGRVWPTDNPSGKIINAFRMPGEARYQHFVRAINNLQRPVHTVYDDLTGNGFADIVVCEFGNYTGSLAWYEHTPTGYQKHILLSQAGAVRAYTTDMNNDGLKDIVALMSQGDEALWIFYNQGNGTFTSERVLRFNPSFGSIYFELVDFNDDGYLDILYCNGDNGDYHPILKNYHGIRIFENDGANRFAEVYFFPMDGVYKASAADFDHDGDLDIFAIAFYPDFSRESEENIVYLENNGINEYTPKGLAQEVQGRWITFDIGDIDHDGDLDILLGSYTGFTTFMDPTKRIDESLRSGNSLLLLRNEHL